MPSRTVDLSLTPRDPLLGRVLDERYRVLRRIGKGGMGNVYLAEHVLIGRKVAIKTLHETLCNPELIERFHREARAAAAIGNEHIVDVTDMGCLDSGAYYLVLEYLEGMDLGFRVASQGPLQVAAAVGITLQLCAALRAVHAAGIVHRDLKPDNLFLITRDGCPDFLKVLDFGVCKFREGEQWRRLTATGVALGTPHYMAPEQVEGRNDVDRRADVYAVGGVLHFALTGSPPFDGPSMPSLFIQICEDPPRPVCSLRPEVPRELEQIVLRALSKRREDRYQDAAQLAAALRSVLTRLEQSPAQRAQMGAAAHAPAESLHAARAPRDAVAHAPVESLHAARAPRSGYGSRRLDAAQAERDLLHLGQTLPAGESAAESGSTLPGRRRWPLRLSAAGLGIALALGFAQLTALYAPTPDPNTTSVAPATHSQLEPADSQVPLTRLNTAAPANSVPKGQSAESRAQPTESSATRLESPLQPAAGSDLPRGVAPPPLRPERPHPTPARADDTTRPSNAARADDAARPNHAARAGNALRVDTARGPGAARRGLAATRPTTGVPASVAGSGAGPVRAPGELHSPPSAANPGPAASIPEPASAAPPVVPHGELKPVFAPEARRRP